MDADAEHPGNIADEMRKQGINLIVIGIGPGTNQTELDHMAGGPDNAFSAASFQELIGGDFIKTLTDKSCETGISFLPYLYTCMYAYIVFTSCRKGPIGSLPLVVSS